MITRSDLAPGHQATQAAHALAAFCTEHPDLAGFWSRRSSYLVLLAVPDEAALLALYGAASGLPRSMYREPDLDGTATSVAIGPERFGDVLSDATAARLLAQLPLLLREDALV